MVFFITNSYVGMQSLKSNLSSHKNIVLHDNNAWLAESAHYFACTALLLLDTVLVYRNNSTLSIRSYPVCMGFSDWQGFDEVVS